jgi:hypothetical protein
VFRSQSSGVGSNPTGDTNFCPFTYPVISNIGIKECPSKTVSTPTSICGVGAVFWATGRGPDLVSTLLRRSNPRGGKTDFFIVFCCVENGVYVGISAKSGFVSQIDSWKPQFLAEVE